MEDIIANWIASVLSMFMGSVQSITSVLGQNLQNNVNMWGMVTSVQGIIKPVCYTILCIFFLVDFLKTSIKIDMIKWEDIFKSLIKFAVAKGAIDFAPLVFDAIYSQIALWTTQYGSVAYDPSFMLTIADNINKALDEMGFWQVIGFAITSIIPAIVLLACSFIVKVIAYGRLIEIYVLLAFMSIPCALILDSEGGTNATKKYILNFAGVCLQGFLIVVACSLYQFLMADVLVGQTSGVTDAGDLLFTMVLGAVVMVLAVIKCGQWGKQILNAI